VTLPTLKLKLAVLVLGIASIFVVISLPLRVNDPLTANLLLKIPLVAVKLVNPVTLLFKLMIGLLLMPSRLVIVILSPSDNDLVVTPLASIPTIMPLLVKLLSVCSLSLKPKSHPLPVGAVSPSPVI
jgi:hypothetical protein